MSVSCTMLGKGRFALWRKLAVFPSSFDDLAAAAVWKMEADAAKHALGDLLAYSLIEYDGETARYRLHDLARIFADGQLSDSERGGTKRRHAVHYRQVLNQAGGYYMQGAGAVTYGLAMFDRERENIEVGWAWAAGEADKNEQASEFCIGYPNLGAQVLDLRQHPRERIRWLEVMLEAARRLTKRNLRLRRLATSVLSTTI